MAGNLKKVFQHGTAFWTEQKRKFHSTLSCVCTFPCPVGVAVDHYIFGQGDEYICSHVMTALKYVCQVLPQYTGNVDYVLYYPSGMTITDEITFSKVINWKPGTFNKTP